MRLAHTAAVGAQQPRLLSVPAAQQCRIPRAAKVVSAPIKGKLLACRASPAPVVSTQPYRLCLQELATAVTPGSSSALFLRPPRDIAQELHVRSDGVPENEATASRDPVAPPLMPRGGDLLVDASPELSVLVSQPVFSVQLRYRPSGGPLEGAHSCWAHVGHSGWQSPRDIELRRCSEPDGRTCWAGEYSLPAAELANPAHVELQLAFKGHMQDGSLRWHNNAGDNWQVCSLTHARTHTRTHLDTHHAPPMMAACHPSNRCETAARRPLLSFHCDSLAPISLYLLLSVYILAQVVAELSHGAGLLLPRPLQRAAQAGLHLLLGSLRLHGLLTGPQQQHLQGLTQQHDRRLLGAYDMVGGSGLRICLLSTYGIFCYSVIVL